MTTETDVKQRLAALRATLAGATMACPECGEHCHKRTPQKPYFDILNTACLEHGIVHICDCDTCQGTGEVARFPGFRQPCPCTDPEFEGIPIGQACKCELASNHDGSIGETNQRGACFGCRLAGYHDSTCPHILQPDPRCNGLGWQVRAGGMEDALAGLTIIDADAVAAGLQGWLRDDIPGRWDSSMPDRDAILVKTLELVCLEANLIRPCLRHGGTDWAGGSTCSECEVLGGYVVIEVAGLEVPNES